MHTKIYSATTLGVCAFPVEVEVDLSYGMLQFHIVGLPDTAIKESKQRIITGLKNAGLKLPERKVTVNLAPADLKKEGTLFDLPIALGIIHAAHSIDITQTFLAETVVIGELSLDGSIKGVKGALAIAYDLVKLGKKRLILPLENMHEAALMPNIQLIGVAHLSELLDYIQGKAVINHPPALLNEHPTSSSLDFNQVKGQRQAKRALQIAAAGRHNLLFVGSPGSGKSMLAQRLQTIMPPLTLEEKIETTKIYSISGKLPIRELIQQRPFRSPHHTISKAGLIGGGTNPQPGEVSLAHNGILFLDELTEFGKTTLEALRQPLETYEVCISRANYAATFPAQFLLICAFNPCPCGFYGDKRKTCNCTTYQIHSYLHKLSGPLLDRIDLQVTVQPVEYESLIHNQENISSAELYIPIQKAIAQQKKRFVQSSICSNAFMPSTFLDSSCMLTTKAKESMKNAFEKLAMSVRGYHKTLKIARTIADLDESEHIHEHHLHEALSYRSFDYYKEQKI